MANAAQEEKSSQQEQCPYIVDVIKLIDPETKSSYPGTDDNLAYFIIDRSTSECAVVDPAVCEPPIIKRYKELKQQYPNLKLTSVLTTHKHYDHSAGNGEMRQKFKDIKVYGGKADNIKAYLNANQFTDEVVEGDIIQLGATKITIYDVPCHTKGHVLYYLTDAKLKFPGLVTGDTLFVGGVGHFFEGTADAMLANFKKIATKFSKDTKLYVGHEYAVSNLEYGAFIEPENVALKERFEFAKTQKKNDPLWYVIESTVGQELESNVFMRTSQKTVVENVKKYWKNAAKKDIAEKYAVKVESDCDKWSEGDVIGALRLLKTYKIHKL
mmetsp:Transcript_294/g.484  ORF Transcript_294/g.484 Transcript_294/m.484 type:complete len:326 (-) Transcript_294:119-1096(-)